MPPKLVIRPEKLKNQITVTFYSRLSKLKLNLLSKSASIRKGKISALCAATAGKPEQAMLAQPVA